MALTAASAVILLTTAFQAFAVDDELIQAQAGQWLLAPVNGGKGCRIDLQATQASGGYAVDGADACTGPLPALAGAKAWNFAEDGSLSLFDTTGKAVVRFQQDEEGSPWQSEDANPIWLLPAVGDVDHVPTVAGLAGKWQIRQQDGKPLCDVTLSSETDSDGTPKMSPGGNCPADIADLKLSLWALEGFGLVLMGNDGSSLSFDMTPDANFRTSDEEEGDPRLLVRQ
jgi:hypothetical protein